MPVSANVTSATLGHVTKVMAHVSVTLDGKASAAQRTYWNVLLTRTSVEPTQPVQNRAGPISVHVTLDTKKAPLANA